MDCHICQLIKEKKNKVFENEDLYVFAAEEPSVAGHIIAVPKAHIPILEEVSDRLAGDLFWIANKVSVSVFESIGAHGTNILVNNGHAAGQDRAHVQIHILPRRENDGLDLDWKPKQLSEEEMSTTELFIKDKVGKVGIIQEDKKAPVEVKDDTEKMEADEEDYMLKQLKRTP
ncbi:MAG: HIT family protein [Candidatus Nanoarchaeia archaeon]